MLTQQDALLAIARLLMARNWGCAMQHAYKFALAAVDLGAAGAEVEDIVALTYDIDRATRATIWVRCSGNGHVAWNVSCG